ncbi:MAG: CehA/McbA family metallohydrolase [Deltaproteobacteria bacterium]|jgi:hypothetical protein|nr:CehA/McbA family metallohydrolase [Deltaproteobacteria bacterium]
MSKKGLIAAIALSFFVSLATLASAEVKVDFGPTPIPSGAATSDKDLTIQNGKLAISINVETPGPWGMPQGGIMDGAPVRDGKIDPDRLAWVDFLPDNWSEFIPKETTVEIVSQTPQEVVVKTVRDWNGLLIEGNITVRDGDDVVLLKTTFTNATDKEVSGIASGFCMWPLGGYFLPMVGTGDGATGLVPPTDAFADWVANYDETWLTALHAPYVDVINYEGKDLHKRMTLKPGESFEFQGFLQILDGGDLAPVVALEMTREGTAPATVAGLVKTAAGEAVDKPVVVVKKDSKLYFWATGEKGRYTIQLPEGDYELYAIAAGFGPSSSVKVKAVAGEKVAADFSDVSPSSVLKVQVTDQATKAPMDAQLAIVKGYTPEVMYLGRKIFFTDLDLAKRGQAEIELAQGDYVLEARNGAGFLSEPSSLAVSLASGVTTERTIGVVRRFSPADKGWLTIDLHQHSNILDGNTSPELVSLWHSARGLDVSVVSDHDSVASQAVVAEQSGLRGMGFIPGIEISPSWAHFNILGQPIGAELTVNPGVATMGEILADSRKIGAKIFQVNHPFETYGYWNSRDAGKIPGGYVDVSKANGFDLVELNSYYIYEHTERILKEMYEFWDQGRRIYLGTGSDFHDPLADAWSEIRMAVHSPGELDIDAFIKAILDGNTYVTMGPFVYPDGFEFGAVAKATGEVRLKLESVKQVKKATLISNGQAASVLEWPEGLHEGDMVFPVDLEPGWFHLILTGDDELDLLWTNPVWVEK